MAYNVASVDVSLPVFHGHQIVLQQWDPVIHSQSVTSHKNGILGYTM